MNKGNMYFNPILLTLHWLHLNKSLLWFKAEASVSQSVLWVVLTVPIVHSWKSSNPCSIWRTQIFCPQWKLLSNEQKATYFSQAETERCCHTKKNPDLSTKDTTYVQTANMQSVHVCITELNDEKITEKSLYQLLKILLCLFLGQKEKESLTLHL